MILSPHFMKQIRSPQNLMFKLFLIQEALSKFQISFSKWKFESITGFVLLCFRELSMKHLDFWDKSTCGIWVLCSKDFHHSFIMEKFMKHRFADSAWIHFSWLKVLWHSMLHSMGSQRAGHDWVTELNWTEGIMIQQNIFLPYGCYLDIAKKHLRCLIWKSQVIFSGAHNFLISSPLTHDRT